ncbi:tyrosine-type recombinase/integrase, partial [Singulisphaera acidiphila]
AARLYQARRLEIVRTLTRYLAPREPGTEIPARGLLGPAHARRPAFLYSEAQIAALVEAARSLAPSAGLRPLTYATLIGLLACTGLRIGEALALGAGDIDFDAGVVTVRQTKFHKTRLVPLHATSVRPLRDYAQARGRLQRGPAGTAFFISENGCTLPYTTVRQTFHRLLQKAMPGAAPVGRVRPRLHDLRHTFVCRRLLEWYGDGTPIERAIDQLSAYLGHVKVTDTYWYLTGVPELLALACQRFERFADPKEMTHDPQL